MISKIGLFSVSNSFSQDEFNVILKIKLIFFSLTEQKNGWTTLLAKCFKASVPSVQKYVKSFLVLHTWMQNLLSFHAFHFFKKNHFKNVQFLHVTCSAFLIVYTILHHATTVEI